MRLTKTLVVILFFTFLSSGLTGFGQLNNVLVKREVAKRNGLEIMWQTQVKTGPASKLQTVTQVFGTTKKLVKYVVTFEDIIEEFYEDDVDRFGRPIGVDGAKARAEARLKRYESIDPKGAAMTRVVEDPDALEKAQEDLLKQYESAEGFEKGRLAQRLAGIKARRERLLPEITILAQTSTSMIQSIDGRTGKTHWTQQVGQRDIPCQPVVAKRNHFAVVNGTTVYCGLLENGRVVWERECRGAPISKPAMTRNSIFVPMVDGFVEQFDVNNGDAPTGDIVSIGQSLLGATASDYVVAWPSDKGELNVTFDRRQTREVSYRLVPKREIVSNAAFQSPYLFATSTDGSIYCLREVNGRMIWDLPTGVPIKKSPFPVGEYVYFIDVSNDLTQVTIDGGIPIWTTRNIEKLLAVSSTRLYCLNSQDRLIILDKKTGGYIGALTDLPVAFVYANSMTDRLIIGTLGGRIQCLREVGQVEPIFYETPEVADESKAVPAGQQPGLPNNQPAKPNNDPFNAKDPFGGGGGKGGAAKDPFGGGGDDPFGGGGGAMKNDDDPFGGGGAGAANDDPFGAGGGAAANDDPFGK